MRWKYEDLQTFLLVLESGSLTRASDQMNLSKSVLSKRIADLEAALGRPLFTRRAGRLVPTEAALALAERVRPLVAGLAEAVESAAWGAHGLRGRLSVSVPVTFGTLHLNPVLAGFAAAHPDLHLSVDYDDRMVDLVSGGFDVAVRVGTVREQSLIARKLCDDRRVICASPSYLAAMGTPVSVNDLARFACIDYANMRHAALWHFQTETGPISIAMQGRIAVNNGEAMRDMAVAGLGLALLPMFIAAAPLADGRLVEVLPQARPPSLPVSAIYPPSRPVPPKVRLFVDHLARALGPEPPWISANG